MIGAGLFSELRSPGGVRTYCKRRRRDRYPILYAPLPTYVPTFRSIPLLTRVGTLGYVGYDPLYTKSVVVAHQGTNPESIMADLVDADFILAPFNQSLFPGLPVGLEAHMGFLGTQSRYIFFLVILSSRVLTASRVGRTAADVLAAVTQTLASSGSRNVLITGHSLGAAIALLDAVYLPLHLPPTTVFTTSVFGLPRVGNPAFADYGL